MTCHCKGVPFGKTCQVSHMCRCSPIKGIALIHRGQWTAVMQKSKKSKKSKRVSIILGGGDSSSNSGDSSSGTRPSDNKPSLSDVWHFLANFLFGKLKQRQQTESALGTDPRAAGETETEPETATRELQIISVVSGPKNMLHVISPAKCGNGFETGHEMP